MERHQRAKQTTFITLVLASSLRYLCPLFGFVWFGILGCFIGLLISLICHWLIKDYMGFRIFSVKPITSITDFIEIPRSLVPSASEKLSAFGYQHIEQNASVYAKEYLRQFSDITHFEYVNACLLDSQFGEYAEAQDERIKAANSFHSHSSQSKS